MSRIRIPAFASALALGVSLAVAACGGGTGGGGATYQLTAADSGSALQAAVGDEIVITLEANPTTGYSWQLAPGLDPSVVAFGSESYQQQSAEPAMVGVGGTDTWTFDAVGEGTTTIPLAYVRSGDPVAAESFTVTVTVTR